MRVMNWVRTHPYASLLAVAGLFILTIVVAIQSRTADSASSQGSAWGIGGAWFDHSYAGTSTSPIGEVIPNAVLAGTGTSALSSPLALAATQNTGESDLSSILATLTHTRTQIVNETVTDSADLARVYGAIPQALIATTTPSGRSPRQQELFEYGNEAGEAILLFERLHPNTAQVLKDQAEDRSDAAKAAALVALGNALASIGTTMQKIENVPDDIASLNDSLAQGYIDAGVKLARVPQAQSDEDFVKAILTYDSSVHVLAQRFGAVASYFALNDVTFANTDAGSAFSFSSASGR